MSTPSPCYLSYGPPVAETDYASEALRLMREANAKGQLHTVTAGIDKAFAVRPYTIVINTEEPQ